MARTMGFSRTWKSISRHCKSTRHSETIQSLLYTKCLFYICYDVMGCILNILQLSSPSFMKGLYLRFLPNASSFWYIYTRVQTLFPNSECQTFISRGPANNSAPGSCIEELSSLLRHLAEETVKSHAILDGFGSDFGDWARWSRDRC